MGQRRERADNFNAGPAVLPEPALQAAREEMLNYKGTGMSVLEISHRSAEYNEIQQETEASLRRLLGVNDDYQVLFLQGGASLQFAMLPMNFVGENQTAAYALSGSWSEKAMQEAANVAKVRTAASSKDAGFRAIPQEWNAEPADAYLHITSNNTIFGTQWQAFPEDLAVPLVADMSSDILSRPFDVNQFHLIYAGAQKNLGPAGVTLVLLKKTWRAQENITRVPKILRYETHVKGDSKYNTPPVFAVYFMGKVLHWLESVGGLEAIQKQNRQKADLLYRTIDESDGFYTGYAEHASRSGMNVTFNLRTPELEKKFLERAKESGFVGLNGHRSVGGCRASIYNALALAACERLAQFMNDFRQSEA